MSSITLKSLSKHFAALRAVDNLDLEVPHGSFTALLGPSGCGKTTTMNMISGLERPTTGEVYFDERPMSKVAIGERNVGFVFQNYAIFTHLSVYENLAFGLKSQPRRARAEKSEIDRRVKAVAETVGLAAALDRPAARLSVNDLQKVALGPLDDHGADDLPARRAVLEPRLGVPRLHARRAQAHPARGRPDDGVRDPRSGRGDGHGRPDRGHGPRASCSSTARRRISTSGPPTRSSPASSARC